MPAPALDNDLGLGEGIEDLGIEQLIAHPTVETLDEAVSRIGLPGAM